MKTEDIIIYDSQNYPTFADYKEYCEINEIEPKQPNSCEYWEYVDECLMHNYQDFEEYIKEDCNEWAIDADLGRWNGRSKAKTKIYGLYDAIMLCLQGSEDCVIKEVSDSYEVVCKHHDATNYFKLTKIKKQK